MDGCIPIWLAEAIVELVELDYDVKVFVFLENTLFYYYYDTAWEATSASLTLHFDLILLGFSLPVR